jgi:hypothetical protein
LTSTIKFDTLRESNLKEHLMLFFLVKDKLVRKYLDYCSVVLYWAPHGHILAISNGTLLHAAPIDILDDLLRESTRYGSSIEMLLELTEEAVRVHRPLDPESIGETSETCNLEEIKSKLRDFSKEVIKEAQRLKKAGIKKNPLIDPTGGSGGVEGRSGPLLSELEGYYGSDEIANYYKSKQPDEEKPIEGLPLIDSTDVPDTPYVGSHPGVPPTRYKCPTPCYAGHTCQIDCETGYVKPTEPVPDSFTEDLNHDNCPNLVPGRTTKADKMGEKTI